MPGHGGGSAASVFDSAEGRVAHPPLPGVGEGAVPVGLEMRSELDGEAEGRVVHPPLPGVGERAVLVGLKMRSELNGEAGVVVGHTLLSGEPRAVFELDIAGPDTRAVRVLASNIRCFRSARRSTAPCGGAGATVGAGNYGADELAGSLTAPQRDFCLARGLRGAKLWILFEHVCDCDFFALSRVLNELAVAGKCVLRASRTQQLVDVMSHLGLEEEQEEEEEYG